MSRLARLGLLAFVGVFAALADPILPGDPTFFPIYQDAVTGNNLVPGCSACRFVSPGADSYDGDFYERPTAATYVDYSGVIAAEQYFPSLDIVSGAFVYDANFLYVALKLFGTESGLLDYEYGFRISDDLNGAGGLLLYSAQPTTKAGTSGVWTQEQTYGYLDTNNDVGGPLGRNVPNEGVIDGFDLKVIDHGMTGTSNSQEGNVLWVRINPGDPTEVQFAFYYPLFGFTQDDLDGVALELQAIKGGPKDGQNYLWNDKYTSLEAGSPYVSPGLGNLYELDTLGIGGGGPPAEVPEPGTLSLLCLGVFALFAYRRKIHGAAP